MFEIGSLQSMISLALTAVLFVVKAFAVGDCLARAPRDFVRAETLSKGAWLLILGLSVAAHLIWWYPLGMLNLAGTVAALVYLAQLRGSSY
ncbi:MAG: DUF2516 family protein [Aeromicrobium sp.]|uniref:DUF2516 family protein n=1 Tax=Aeromicrobium sp. TaxID=1871063 RepID=UPI0039E6773A